MTLDPLSSRVADILASYVTPIPDGLSSEDAAPMLCAGITTYAALRRSNAPSGSWVVVSGAGGGLGHIAVQLSARGFAHRVIGIDAPSKKDLVLESGAEHFIDAFAHDDKSIAEEVVKLTGGLGAHAVIVCTASNRAYAQAMDFLRFKGVLVCVGMPEGDLVPIAKAFPSMMVGKMLSITSTAVGNKKEASEVLEMAARGIVKTKVRIEKMEKLQQIFEEMGEGKLQGRVVLDLS
jgi:propanol-preferring alcohol dehydrogenase